MRDGRRTALRLFALFLIAFMGIHNQWAPIFSSKNHNDDKQNLRHLLKGKASRKEERGEASRKGKINSNNDRRPAENALIADTNRVTALSGFSEDIQEGQVVISGMQLTYRCPRTFSETTSESDKDTNLVVVGVLSAANEQGDLRRKGVRKTWSNDKKGRVFFVVAGDWSNVEKEFEEHQDLIWVDMEDKWSHLTCKVQTFYHAVENHFELSYDCIMKTDDDSYLFLPALNSFLKKSNSDLDYSGHCVSSSKVIRQPGHRHYVPKSVYSPHIYPPYATGEGYLVSKDLNECMLDHIATIDYMPMEDCATGILARKCHTGCTSMKNIFVKHHVRTNKRMQSSDKQWDFMKLMSERSQLRMLSK